MTVIHNNPGDSNRRCHNCACFRSAEVPDEKGGTRVQGMCLLATPEARQVRLSVPVLKDGRPVMDKLRPTQPLTREQIELAYVPALTKPELSCHSWRPLGCLPGESLADLRVKRIAGILAPWIQAMAGSDELVALFGRIREEMSADPTEWANPGADAGEKGPTHGA